jgi:hypothetical protein
MVCLEEAGAEYELVRMSRSGGDHRRQEHLARNVSTSEQSLLHSTLVEQSFYCLSAR